MGIKGLLPILKKVLKRTHVSRYSNTRIGIDGHSWIHRVIPHIAAELYYSSPTQKHLDLFMSKLSGLLGYGITPILVFDGDFLESKRKTVEERRLQREKCRAEVELHLRRNDAPRARELMKRCVSVTPEILHSILRVLRANNIEFIVSPYEADAQLCFLQRTNYIDYILTEDSDLVAYGATRVLYKYDGAHVEEYDSSRLHLCRDRHFQENILDICILSGCDYLDSIRGVGIITAHEKLKELGDVSSFVNHMQSLKRDVPRDYIDGFSRAKATFLHHIVYNPYAMQRQFLSEPKAICDFLGSLENLPFTFNTHLGTGHRLDRHFIPRRAAGAAPEDRDNCSSEVPDDCVLDSNLALPYF